MIRYTLRRLVSMIPTLIGITVIVFLFIHLIPGDPATAMLRENCKLLYLINIPLPR